MWLTRTSSKIIDSTFCHCCSVSPVLVSFFNNSSFKLLGLEIAEMSKCKGYITWIYTDYQERRKIWFHSIWTMYLPKVGGVLSWMRIIVWLRWLKSIIWIISDQNFSSFSPTSSSLIVYCRYISDRVAITARQQKTISPIGCHINHKWFNKRQWGWWYRIRGYGFPMPKNETRTVWRKMDRAFAIFGFWGIFRGFDCGGLINLENLG